MSLRFPFYYNNRIDKNVKLLGQPNINEPIPLTTKWAMGAVPYTFIGMGAFMSGAYWIIKRREKMSKKETEI